MRPGPLEIVVILAVILAIIILARIFRAKPASKAADRQPPSATNAWGVLQRIGVVLIVLGIIYFIGAIGVFEMLGWALRSYLWALPAIIIGILFVLLARRK